MFCLCCIVLCKTGISSFIIWRYSCRSEKSCINKKCLLRGRFIRVLFFSHRHISLDIPKWSPEKCPVLLKPSAASLRKKKSRLQILSRVKAFKATV